MSRTGFGIHTRASVSGQRCPVREHAPRIPGPGRGPVLLLAVLSLLACAGSTLAQFSRAFNSGGDTLVFGGIKFETDQAYNPPGARAGYVGGRIHVGNGDMGIGGGEPHDLYRLCRAAPSAYRFECPAGSYVVTLGFTEKCEIWKKGGGEGPGLRTFTVTAEGKTVLGALDIAAEGGNYHAVKIRFHTEVKDGRLDVEFLPGLGEAILSFIHVLQRAPDTRPPQTPGGFRVRPGFGRNILAWNPTPEDDFTGVHVLRAPHGSTAFSTVFTSRVLPAMFPDHAAEAGKALDYRLLPLDVFGNAGAATAVLSATARNLEAPGIRNYHVTLDTEALKTLDSNPFADIKVPATFTYRNLSYPVRVRYRGSSGRNFAKKCWKVDFGRSVFEGRREINLQAEFRDIFGIRDKMVYDVFKAAGIMSPKGRFVHLLLNGEELGLYTEVEQVNERFLEMHGRDDDGAMYQPWLGTLHPLPSVEKYRTHYWKKTKTSAGYEDLIAFIDRINRTSNADFPRAISEVLDVDSYLGYQAVVNWMGSWDAVQVNSFLVHLPDLGRWEVIPWDHDTSLSNHSPTLEIKAELPIDYGTLSSPQGQVYNQLLTRVLDVAVFRWKYVEKLEALSAGPCSPAALGSRLEEAGSEVRAVGEADLLKWGWEDSSYFIQGPAVLKQYSPLRITYLNKVIPGYKPAAGPRVIINEIMAENDTTVRDEAGDYDDWIELFNPGQAAVDVSGMYLTDRLDNPVKWKIPAGTSLAAGGRLLVWADEEPTEGKLHASFKLSMNGEQVALFDTDGTTLVDVVHFNRLDADLSQARTTDGHAFFKVTATPTPGAPNRIGGDLPPRLSCRGRTPNAPGPGAPTTLTIRAQDDLGIRSVHLFHGTGSGYQQTAMHDDGNHGDGLPGDGIFGVVVPGSPARTRVHYYFRAEDTGGRSCTDPRSAPGKTRSYTVLSPAPGSALRIHEFLAENLTGIRDEKGDLEDWIEIHNAGPLAVDAGGLYLTDDLNDPTRWPIPLNTSIPAGGTLLVWADGEPLEGALHAPFRLSAGGEEIGLFDRDGITLLDAVVFGGQFADTSTGRLPSISGIWATFPDPTPKKGNRPPAAVGYLRYSGQVPGPALPALTGAGTPRPGGKAVFQILGAPASASGFLVLSLNPLDVALPGLGTVLVNPVGLWFPVKMTPQGNGILEVPVPQVATLSGLHLFGQALVFSGATPLLSNGLVVRIGP